jgi:hypothetical protein
VRCWSNASPLLMQWGNTSVATTSPLLVHYDTGNAQIRCVRTQSRAVKHAAFQSMRPPGYTNGSQDTHASHTDRHTKDHTARNTQGHPSSPPSSHPLSPRQTPPRHTWLSHTLPAARVGRHTLPIRVCTHVHASVRVHTAFRFWKNLKRTSKRQPHTTDQADSPYGRHIMLTPL